MFGIHIRSSESRTYQIIFFTHKYKPCCSILIKLRTNQLTIFYCKFNGFMQCLHSYTASATLAYSYTVEYSCVCKQMEWLPGDPDMSANHHVVVGNSMLYGAPTKSRSLAQILRKFLWKGPEVWKALRVRIWEESGSVYFWKLIHGDAAVLWWWKIIWSRMNRSLRSCRDITISIRDNRWDKSQWKLQLKLSSTYKWMSLTLTKAEMCTVPRFTAVFVVLPSDQQIQL